MRPLIAISRIGMGVVLTIHFFGCSVAQKSSIPESKFANSTSEFQEKPATDTLTVLANVNGHGITLEDFNDRLNKLAPQMRQSVAADPKARREFIEDLINIELVLQEARRQGIGQDEVSTRQQDRYSQEQANVSLFNALLKKELGEKLAAVPEPTSDEIMNYYNQNTDKLSPPDGKRPEFKDAQPQLKRRILAEKRRMLYLDYVAMLRSRATITVNESALEAAGFRNGQDLLQ